MVAVIVTRASFFLELSSSDMCPIIDRNSIADVKNGFFSHQKHSEYYLCCSSTIFTCKFFLIDYLGYKTRPPPLIFL